MIPIPSPLASWILEFFLRQHDVDDSLIRHIFHSLPVPVPLQNHRLIKTILLRSLHSHITNDSTSERTLQILELIEELDRDHHSTSPPSLKAAYCAVAVDCTVTHLRDQHHHLFSDAVYRIWTSRVSDLQVSEAAAALFSDQLKENWREMEDALSDFALRRRLVERHNKAKAFHSVSIYLDEALEELGPSCLEVKAEKMLSKDFDASLAVSHGHPLQNAATGRNDSSCPDAAAQCPTDHSRTLDERKKQKENAVTGDEAPSYTNAQPPKEHMSLSTPEVVRARAALQKSCALLQDAVEDPLPDAVAIAAELQSIIADKPPNMKEHEHELNPEGVRDPGPPSLNVREVVHAEVAVTCSRDHADHDAQNRPSIMDRNPTAHTYEWDDSIEMSSEGSPNASKKIRLPSLKKRRISPLSLPKATKYARRRIIKKWTQLEEDTLREGVKKHGKGNWKFILNCYPGIFLDRTEVDLKDKWRNMSRLGL